MVVGWYHSHPGFGCWLSGVDINTQQVYANASYFLVFLCCIVESLFDKHIFYFCHSSIVPLCNSLIHAHISFFTACSHIVYGSPFHRKNYLFKLFLAKRCAGCSAVPLYCMPTHKNICNKNLINMHITI